MTRALRDAIRQNKPLIHCISNIVTANDCANLLLAIGASPIMAQAAEEMPDISAAAQAVVLNTGTPSAEKFAACRAAGQTANRCGVPVVLDPVGVGASPWRLTNLQLLLQDVQPAILRANPSEARALLRLRGAEQGVDSTASTLEERRRLAAACARRLGCTVLLTGTEDVVSDGEQVVTLTGGSEKMRRITGAGCMLSALCGAFAAVAPSPFEAACAAARFWKQTAADAEALAAGRGMGSYHTALFDAASV